MGGRTYKPSTDTLKPRPGFESKLKGGKTPHDIPSRSAISSISSAKIDNFPTNECEAPEMSAGQGSHQLTEGLMIGWSGNGLLKLHGWERHGADGGGALDPSYPERRDLMAMAKRPSSKNTTTTSY